MLTIGVLMLLSIIYVYKMLAQIVIRTYQWSEGVKYGQPPDMSTMTFPKLLLEIKKNKIATIVKDKRKVGTLAVELACG